MEVMAMEKERIEEILKDPNTWAWDGCTYSDLDEKIDTSYLDNVIDKIFEQVA